MMRCPGCGYILRGLGKGPCPECGRAFDPDDPATLVRTPWISRRRRKRILTAATGAALLWLLSWWIPVPYYTLLELDWRTGQSRRVHVLLGRRISEREHPTPFGAFSREYLRAPGGGEWHAYHYASPFDRKRVHYSHASYPSDLQDLADAFVLEQVPHGHRMRLARAALEFVARRTPIRVVTGDGGVQVRAGDGEVEEWRPEPRSNPDPGR